MAVPDSVLVYVRKALDKKFPAVVIRTALKKAGHNDQTISAAFEQVRKERERVAPKPSPPIPKVKPRFKTVQEEETLSDIPPEPPAFPEPEEIPQDIPPPPQEDWMEIPHPPPIDEAQQKHKVHVRHLIVAALFLIAVILLMYATLAPLLLRIT